MLILGHKEIKLRKSKDISNVLSFNVYRLKGFLIQDKIFIFIRDFLRK